MEILWWILVGLVAGALGKFILPGKDPGGCAVTMLIGIAGAILAGFVGRMIGFSEPGEDVGLWRSLIGATLGAIVLLILYRVIMRKRTGE